MYCNILKSNDGESTLTRLCCLIFLPPSAALFFSQILYHGLIDEAELLESLFASRYLSLSGV